MLRFISRKDAKTQRLKTYLLEVGMIGYFAIIFFPADLADWRREEGRDCIFIKRAFEFLNAFVYVEKK